MVKLHKHNEETYQKIVSMFAENDRVCAVQPTGTGKSFLILKLIEDNPDKEFLITAPNTYVFGQIKNHAESCNVDLENCTFMTYTSLYEYPNLEEISCDYLICDEFHRLGAATWNEGILRFLNTHNCKVLGTSATPIRYLDSMRDMAEELFHSNYAVNMSLAEAIQLKILPLPIYVTTLFNFWGDVAELEKKAEKTENPRLKLFLAGKIKKAKTMISSLDCGIEMVFNRHMKDKSGKYIVFCPDIEKMNGIYEECDSWFEDVNRNIHKYSVYARNVNSNEEFENFCNDSDKTALKLLFCIDMLNEGIHIENINGIIMLRPTQSANVFYQQLGRALSCSLKNPVIFDIVNNYETGDTAKQYQQIMLASRQNESSDDVDIQFEIFDYVRDIREIINELHNTFETSWEFTYETLKRYIEEYNHFPGVYEIYEGVKLGSWCLTQRTVKKAGKLSPERIRKLDDIHFIWDVIEENWHQNYELIKKYIKEHGDKPRLWANSKNEEELYLAHWLHNQKYSYKNNLLSEEKIKLLYEIGIDFNESYSDDLWKLTYQRLKKYIEEYGDFPQLPKEDDSKETKQLYLWLRKQRLAYNKGTLPENRIKLLEEINIVWDRNDEIWENNFLLFQKFYQEYDRLPKNSDRIDGYGIGHWYLLQLKEYKNGSLSEEKIKRFKDAGFSLIPYYEEKAEKYWMKCFELLKKYYAEFHTVPVRRDIYEGVYLGFWYFRLLKDYHNGELSDKKIEMIKSIGINFETRLERDMAINPDKYKKKPRKNIEETWQKNFEILKRYVQEFGCFPTEHTIYEDVQIASWCYHQRELKKAGKLSSDKLEKLNSIDFPWNVNEIRWYQMYDKLKKYVAEHGTPPKSPHTDSMETRKIFTWLTSQRNRFNSGSISEHELKLLAEMQVVFGTESNDEMWLRKYDEFIEFVNTHGRYPLKHRNSTNAEAESSLAAWVQKQRGLNRRGTIVQERKEMLDKIGFI